MRRRVPTPSSGCTAPSSTWASTSSRPTPSASFSVVLAEYGIAERARELADARRRRSRGAWPTSTRAPARRASSPARWARAPSSPPSARSPTTTCRPATRSWPTGSSRAASTCCVVETMYDLLSGKAAIAACHRAMARHGRVVPDPGPGHDRADRAHAARHRDRRGDHRARARSASTCSASTARPDPSRCTSRCATSRETAPMPLSCLPNAGLPSVVDGKMHYDLTPDALAEHLSRFVTEYGVAGRRRLLRHDARAPRARSSRRCDPCARATRTPVLEPAVASIYSAVAVPARTARCCSSASAPTPTAPRSSARRCSRATGTPASAIGRDQIKEGAHILDVCVDYTGADGVADMNELMSRLATQSSVPIMVDTTETKVARAGADVARRQGRCSTR